jgi:hypothetical protein
LKLQKHGTLFVQSATSAYPPEIQRQQTWQRVNKKGKEKKKKKQKKLKKKNKLPTLVKSKDGGSDIK